MNHWKTIRRSLPLAACLALPGTAAAQVDLVAGVDTFTFPGPGVYPAGHTFAAPIWVQNLGQTAAPPSTIAVIFTENSAQPLLNHTVVALVLAPALGPKAYMPLKPTLTLPPCVSGLSPSWAIGCYADALHEVTESSELNNFGSWTNRGVGSYQEGDSRIGFVRKIGTATILSEDKATFPSTKGGVASMCVLNGSRGPLGVHYVLVCSASGNPFRFDAFSELSLTLLNGPVFTRWFSLIDDKNLYRATLSLPPLAASTSLTFFTHAAFFDSKFRFTGFVPQSLENSIER